MSTKYVYKKMFQVSGGHKVNLNLPTDLVRDFWKLKPGDRVVAEVRKIGNRLVFTVEPMK